MRKTAVFKKDAVIIQDSRCDDGADANMCDVHLCWCL